MKVEITRNDLNEALGFTVSVASARTALPILQYLRFTAEENALTALACDGEMWAQRSVLAKVEEPGSVCVSAKVFGDIVASLPESPVRIELEGGHLFLRQGAGEWRFPAMPTVEFPGLPEVKDESRLTMGAGEFRRAIDGVSFAVADDNSRPVLTGVLFMYDGSKLTLVATDTHRMAVLALPKEGIGSQITAVVPEKALRSIKALPIGEDEELTVRFDQDRLFVDSGTAQVASQLLAGTYPNWERVVPGEHTRSWVIDRDELRQNLRRAMILARDNANRVKFSGHSEQVTIAARSEDKGEAKEEVAVVAKNGDIDIAFNGRYVQEAIDAFGGDGVRVELTEPSRPAVFRPVDEEGKEQFCVIMPMALG